MAVRTHIETIISCDGPDGRCPQQAQLHEILPATASISRARGMGWEIDDEVRCPSCNAAPQTAALPVIQTHYRWPTELPGAQVERIRPASPSVIRHLRLA